DRAAARGTGHPQDRRRGRGVRLAGAPARDGRDPPANPVADRVAPDGAGAATARHRGGAAPSGGARGAVALVMAFAKSYTRTSEPRPYDSVLFCGICGVEVHVSRDDERAAGYAHANRAEANARAHLGEHHRLRYWLWQRLGWRWLVGGLAS